MTLPRRLLVVTNMWPRPGAELAGIFVREQVDALRRAAPGMHVDVMEIEGTRSRAAYVTGMARVARVAAKYDLIHAHYGLTSAVASAQTRRPVVSTYHGSDVYVGWQRAISRVGLRRSRGAIFVSNRLRARMGTERGDVIPCGVDLELFRPMDRAAARARLGLAPERRYVLFPGNPARPVKNHALFRAALAALPTEVAATTSEITLHDVPREDVPVHLAACDAVLITSLYEGACNVAKEAIACGRPVVSVEVGDVPEMAALVEGCVVAERDAGALAGGLLRAFDAGFVANGAAALRAARVDAETVAARVLEVYARVLGGRVPPQGPL